MRVGHTFSVQCSDASAVSDAIRQQTGDKQAAFLPAEGSAGSNRLSALQGRTGRQCAALLLASLFCLPAHICLADEANAFARVFNSVPLRRPMKVFPFWLSVLDKNSKHPVFQDKNNFRGVSWSAMRQKASQLKDLDLLSYVNTFWNRYPYIEDIVNWKKEDYWEAPYEFLDRSGDCEDFAIIKYMTLRELGIAADKMRIIVVRDTFRGLAHAVLGVDVNGKVYILDNVSNAILTHARLPQYIPQYSVNEETAWMHIKAKKK